MRELTVAGAMREALREEMQRDEAILLLGGYVRTGEHNSGTTAGLLEEFGDERVIDTPIAEAALAGIAAGAAIAGLRPIVNIGNLGFALAVLDQVSNQAAKAHYTFNGQVSVPVVYWFETALRGWGVHHAQAIYAMFCHMPGLKVVVPSTPHDAKGLLKSALRDDNPVAFVIHPELYARAGAVEEGEYLVEIGQARLAREGADLSIVTSGWFVPRALEVAEHLAAEGLSVEVVDLRSLVPLDWATVTSSARKTGRVVVYDQGHFSCGVGATIAAGIQQRVFRSLKAPVRVLTSADVPVPYDLGLEEQVVPSTDKLVRAARECLADEC